MTSRLMAVVLAAGVLFGGAAPLRAEFEVRLGFGQNWVSPDDFNKTQEALNPDLKLEAMFGGALDVLFHSPILPLFAGLRYEGYGEQKNAQIPFFGGYTYDINVKRISAVAGLHLLDTIVFLGPLVTVGHHSGTIEAGTTNMSKADLDREGISYSIGIDGGVNLKKWTIGAEVSYQSVKFKGLDLSGLYARLLLGRRFL